MYDYDCAPENVYRCRLGGCSGTGGNGDGPAGTPALAKTASTGSAPLQRVDPLATCDSAENQRVSGDVDLCRLRFSAPVWRQKPVDDGDAARASMRGRRVLLKYTGVTVREWGCFRPAHLLEGDKQGGRQWPSFYPSFYLLSFSFLVRTTERHPNTEEGHIISVAASVIIFFLRPGPWPRSIIATDFDGLYVR